MLHFIKATWRAIVINKFIEMLRRFSEKERVRLSYQDTTVQLKTDYLLTILREQLAFLKKT